MMSSIADLLRTPEQHLEPLQREWLAGPGVAGRLAQRLLHATNWSVMRTLFRLRVVGGEYLRPEAQVIFTPNHTSSLDPPALAAALPYRILQNTFWAGRKGASLRNPLRRAFSRIGQAVPVDRDLSALAVGAAVLQRGHNLVWFPEGNRSPSGSLHDFKVGIGFLLQQFHVAALPVFIHGASDAMPPPRMKLRSLHRIQIAFGPPVFAEELGHDGNPRDIAAALFKRVKALQPEGV